MIYYISNHVMYLLNKKLKLVNKTKLCPLTGIEVEKDIKIQKSILRAVGQVNRFSHCFRKFPSAPSVGP